MLDLFFGSSKPKSDKPENSNSESPSPKDPWSQSMSRKAEVSTLATSCYFLAAAACVTGSLDAWLARSVGCSRFGILPLGPIGCVVQRVFPVGSRHLGW